ncbi:hypothetical protein SDC9_155490 [bioreactor metagenome]|uniref:Uncharacterized protein n=1 Tax=bioreactor metagenome TaxID=1076179 RepID=A0A645F1M5_9ZZZZ
MYVVFTFYRALTRCGIKCDFPQHAIHCKIRALVLRDPITGSIQNSRLHLFCRKVVIAQVIHGLTCSGSQPRIAVGPLTRQQVLRLVARRTVLPVRGFRHRNHWHGSDLTYWFYLFCVIAAVSRSIHNPQLFFQLHRIAAGICHFTAKLFCHVKFCGNFPFSLQCKLSRFLLNLHGFCKGFYRGGKVIDDRYWCACRILCCKICFASFCIIKSCSPEIKCSVGSHENTIFRGITFVMATFLCCTY